MRYYRCMKSERRRFHTAVQIFKSLHRLSPLYLCNIFQFSKDVTGHVSHNINRLGQLTYVHKPTYVII